MIVLLLFQEFAGRRRFRWFVALGLYFFHVRARDVHDFLTRCLNAAALAGWLTEWSRMLSLQLWQTQPRLSDCAQFLMLCQHFLTSRLFNCFFLTLIQFLAESFTSQCRKEVKCDIYCNQFIASPVSVPPHNYNGATSGFSSICLRNSAIPSECPMGPTEWLCSFWKLVNLSLFLRNCPAVQWGYKIVM